MREESILLTPAMPRAEGRQDRQPGAEGVPGLLTAVGDRVLNMRGGIAGGLESMGQPASVGSCSNPPVFADVRLDATYVFTLDAEGRLRVESRISPAGSVTMLALELGRIAAGECRMARAGDFLIVADADSALYYIQWNPMRCEYTWLGQLPQMPEATFSVGESTERQGTVPEMEFRTAVADMRSGVPEEVTAQVLAGVATAQTALREEAEAAGWWTVPVMVRYALRLWDGSILHLSDPRLVAPCGFVDYRRADLPLLTGTGGFTGTGVDRFSVPAFRLQMEMDSGTLAAWSDVASEIEVWVSRDIDLAPTQGEGTVGYTHSGTDHTLHITPLYPDDAELTRRMLGAGWQCVAVLPCASGATTTAIVRPAPTADMERSAAGGGALRPVSHATAIAGHGGFLHMVGYTRRLPRPQLPCGEEGATQMAQALVAVTLGTLRGPVTVVARGEVTADDGVILPLLWYPDPTAVSIRVALTYADGRMYERTWPMSPVRGELAACVQMLSSEGVTLLPVTHPPVVLGGTETERVEGSLTTMKRGNPFISEAVTSGAVGHVSAICAQQSGGGAYTRQYLYLFTDTGIVAVTHDMDGRHTNLRPVSRHVVTDRTRITVADSAVWALTDRGALVRITDSKVTRLLTGLPNGFRLASAEQLGEVWMLPAEESAISRSVVLTADGVDTLSAGVSDWMPKVTMPAADRLLGCVPRQTGDHTRWEIAEQLPAGRTDARMTSEWVSPPLELQRGGLAEANVTVTGTDPDAVIEVHCLAPDQTPGAECSDDTLLCSARLTRTNGVMLSIPLLLPNPKHMPGGMRLRFRVAGRFERLGRYGVTYRGVETAEKIGIY